MSETTPEPDLELGYIGTAEAEVIRGPGTSPSTEDEKEPA